MADMFQTVYDLCTAHPKPHSELLFQSLGEFMAEHASLTLEFVAGQDDVVTAYAGVWEQYRVASGYLSVICEYLDRVMVKMMRPPYGGVRRAARQGQFPKMSIEALAFHIWKERVLVVLQNYHGNRLIYQLLEAIRRDRDGEGIAYVHVSQCVASLVQLNQHTAKPLQLYIETFEKPYLEDTKRYYANESSLLIMQHDISSYMVKIDERLAQEVVRNTRMCDPTSLDKVVRQCEHEFITAHLSEIMTEVLPMLEHEKVADCKIAYSLLSRVSGGISALLAIYQQFIVDCGKNIIVRLGQTIPKDPREYAENLMTLHTKYMNFCRDVFSSDLAFTASVDHAFRAIINDRNLIPNTVAPEVLARYCDTLLKKSAKGLVETEVEAKLGQMIVLFKYIEDKDVFQKFYSRMLAKRLIHGTSISDDAEMNMISRLKTACGVEYTTKLQRMFTDTTLSSELNVNFNQHAASNKLKLGVDMNVMVLTAGSWPLTGIVNTDFSLPAELEQSVMHFTTYYGTHYTGRKLTWLHHLAKADVKIHNMDKRYELSLSLYQMGVLLLFNAADDLSLSFADIQNASKLSQADLTRILKIFVDIKLLKHDDKTNTYTVNSKFSNKRTKIKVSTAVQADTPQEISATRQAVDDDRKLYLQAAMVRIMKARKELSHTQLVQEVIEVASSRFAPSVAVIKKCIEQLIDKQYLDRVAGVRDRYVYIS
ncbi:hypothetical protein PhCBS80983_g00954 [Powellomyces hirtus]|uniref:Cullin-5 n=1 Tax=Powellomyces hirtus TaxID=109895 RepID=A0A507ECA2_9FUNG|nr:hypothetical protein PhCBS80983_g00954 [Powellomyces hirtus]